MSELYVNFGDARLPERFWSKVSPCPTSGCWLWTAASSRNGYGIFGRGTRKEGLVYAHRHSYTVLVGDVPAGLDLDHLCRVRCCVNPAHLEPVTRAVNMARSPIASHTRKLLTHCKHGHEFTSENTRINKAGNRGCRECDRIRARDAHARKKTRPVIEGATPLRVTS